MRPKSLILFALALGCGSIAAVGINQVLANRNQLAPQPTGATVPIFVAMADVDLGEQLTSAKVKLEDWPRDKVPPGALTKIEDVDGRRTRTKLFAGEPILAAKLLSKDANSGSATDFIPKGYRVVAVKVDDVSGGSSLIKPGDRVDVIVHIKASGGTGIVETTTRTILQDIKVFAVNDVFHRSSDVEEDTIVARTISLLVTPEQSELVTLASEMGSIRLVMRSIDDETLADTRGASLQELLGGSAVGNRGKEDPTGQHATGNPLIDMLNQHAQPAAAPVEAPAAPGVFKMRVLEGEEAREVEFSAAGVVAHTLPLANPAAGGGNSTASEPAAVGEPNEDGEQPPKADPSPKTSGDTPTEQT